MKELLPLLSNLNIKDALIIASLLILILCFLEIRRLKSSLSREINRRLIPQLNLEFDDKDAALFLKNEGALFAKDIRIEDFKIPINDFGFEAEFNLKFNEIEYLRPSERKKLEFEAFRDGEKFIPDIHIKALLNLISLPAFKAKVFYANIENIRFCSVFCKKNRSFVLEKIEFCK